MVYLKKILLTTDLSEFSLAAMDYAFSFGLLYASKLYVLHVVDPVAPALTVNGFDIDTGIYVNRAEQEGRDDLREFVEKHITPDIALTEIVCSGAPAEEITRFAEEESIDLIVMATHGRTGLSHIVMGSVAEKVMRSSRVPVLVVKPQSVQDTILHEDDIESELHLRG